jgi:exodeoxyribonuclease VII large subunit
VQFQLDFVSKTGTEPSAGFEQGAFLDVVLLVRGGGSLEDLMCFNSEVVARSIAACPLPVVSGVGHEVDVTIADLVADVRAPTPSAAAAAVLPDRRALVAQLRKDWGRLVIAIESRIRQSRSDWLREHEALRVLAPSAKLAAQRARLVAAARALRRAFVAVNERQRARLSELAARLDSLSPLAVLARGYALVRRARDGEIVRRGDQTSVGESLSIRVAAARIEASVESVESVESAESAGSLPGVGKTPAPGR